MYELYHSLISSKDGYTYDMYTAVIHVINPGCYQEIRQAVGITQGLAAVDEMACSKAEREEYFPLALIDTGISFVCGEGQASVEEDRMRILTEIGDKASLLDETVHGVVAAAALERVLKGANKCQAERYLKVIRKSPPTAELMLNFEDSEADSQATVSAVVEALAFRGTTKKLELQSEEAVEIPECLGQLTALEELELNECTSLVALPETINGLTALQELDLGGCSSLVALPDTISKLTALKELNLHRCSSLVALPDTINGLTALEILTLSSCTSLVALPNTIKELVALKQLDLTGIYTGEIGSLYPSNLTIVPDLPGVEIEF